MSDFVPLLIERTEGFYRVSQGADPLLRVPQAVFERFDANCVFPPLWSAEGGIHPVRRLYWNPETHEFLMFGLDENTVVRSGDVFGPCGYRSFLQGFWLPTPPVVLLRPFWKPDTPYDPFDGDARHRSFRVQQRFLSLLDRLLPPDGYSAILNATEPYLEVLGLDPTQAPGNPDEIFDVSLTPAVSLTDPEAAAALEHLAVHQAGDCFPILRQGTLVGVHALGLRERLAVEGELLRRGLACREGPGHAH